MQVSAVIQDTYSKFKIHEQAREVRSVCGTPTFSFTLRGIPTYWTEVYFQTLLSKVLSKQGLFGCKVIRTKSDSVKWSGKVVFTVPKKPSKGLTVTSYIDYPCKTCKSPAGSPCVSFGKQIFDMYHESRGQ